MRKLGWVALAAVIVQGVLGGITVLTLLPPAVSITHACLAQLFFSATVAIAVFTSRSWQIGAEPVVDHGWPSLRSIAVVTPVLVLAQVALGAAFRHRVIGILPHIVGAMVVSLAILLLAVFVLHQFPNHRTLRPSALALLGVTFVQVFLGISAYLARSRATPNPAELVVSTVMHVAVGALTLAATIILSIHILRNVGARVAAEAPHAAVTS
jgi:cytochrome c oxidase assembly protein subunit 15